MVVIKHLSGLYYREDKEAVRMVDCFSVLHPMGATKFESTSIAEEFIVEIKSKSNLTKLVTEEL